MDASFLDQSQNKVNLRPKQSQITFDAQLKIALNVAFVMFMSPVDISWIRCTLELDSPEVSFGTAAFCPDFLDTLRRE